MASLKNSVHLTKDDATHDPVNLQLSGATPQVLQSQASRPTLIVLLPKDSVYQHWRAPVVLEEHKLVFFDVAKVGCTEFFKLFRRVMGFSNWNNITEKLPHSPFHNGLTFLSNYSLEKAAEIMSSPSWTRAIFVRNPKERLLSAYLNKGVHDFDNYLFRKYCKGQTMQKCKKHVATLEKFFDYVTSKKEYSKDIHWRPQWNRIEAKFWPFVNYIGDFANLEHDAHVLLKRVGLWNDYGKDGWGPHGTQSMFSFRPRHATDATTTLRKHYNSTAFEDRVKEFYKMDYTNKYYSHLFESG